MKRFGLILAALFCFATAATAQSLPAKPDYDFALYLLGKRLKKDASTFVATELDSDVYTLPACDSLRFMRGYVCYSLRRFDSAVGEFALVSPVSPLASRSTFFSAISSLETGDRATARNTLLNYPSNGEYAELAAFSLAGLALLEHDEENYRALSSRFTYSSFALSEQEHEFDRIAAKKTKRRSPFVAGALSAVVPGLGKVYAGRVGEGVASFLLVGGLAGAAAEAWIKEGTPKNWRTVVFGAAGSILYVSNIFGSAASVRVYYEEFNKGRDAAVMYGIHIPLRTIFD